MAQGRGHKKYFFKSTFCAHLYSNWSKSGIDLIYILFENNWMMKCDNKVTSVYYSIIAIK